MIQIVIYDSNMPTDLVNSRTFLEFELQDLGYRIHYNEANINRATRTWVEFDTEAEAIQFMLTYGIHSRDFQS